MTALRPERESGSAGEQGGSYGWPPYEDPRAFGSGPGGPYGDDPGHHGHDPYGTDPGTQGPPYDDPGAFGGERYGNGRYDADPYGGAPRGDEGYGAGPHGGDERYGAGPHGGDQWYGGQGYGDGPHDDGGYDDGAYRGAPSERGPAGGGYGPPGDDETMALRVPVPPPGHPADPPFPGDGGRAARRRAARSRHGRRGEPSEEFPEQEAGEDAEAPLSRVEARRRARARKPGPAVIVSRVMGELFITTGVMMLLFVTYQLWWTNVRAHAQADRAASALQDDWASGRAPDAFEPGQGFALLHMPTLDVVVPIAEGTDTKKVLDRGMVGHYADKPLKTAMPQDASGNFGLAGHRNTHGEPFRYINRLKPGDPIVVETRDTYFVYKMASVLPVTAPSNVGVLDPVPRQAGFKSPGRYITLTTCTPEFTSKYRLIVWGKMVEERPRSKGKPDALVS
ncbi:class E sortase [Streptomyces sp. SHP 1-2]|uniref:class E sortase n=1 Tax=Streptomyces sp. SHP 1-2 TaxID=2769489 RepID=UPI0022370832|nr:class E sortase [Streptomyces sp. SHP 1-2]